MFETRAVIAPTANPGEAPRANPAIRTMSVVGLTFGSGAKASLPATARPASAATSASERVDGRPRSKNLKQIIDEWIAFRFETVTRRTRHRLGEVDRRIRFLSRRLEMAEVVDNAGQDHDRVFFGATVRIAREDDSEQVLSIVGIDEIDTERGRISWVSPMARALTKAREGDTVTLHTPAGVEDVEIVEVNYLPIE